MSASTMTMEKANKIAQERIAKLEAEVERLQFELAQAHNQHRYVVKKLEAENRRLRGGE